jgi:hypothetical protein
MPTDQVTRAQFAALMALLAGGDSRVRGELTKQLPADRAVLVEQLLARTSSAAPDGVRTDVAAVRLFDGASETNAHALLAQLMAAQASRGSAEGAMAADRLPMNRRSTDQLLMDARPVDRVGTDRPLMGTQPMDRVATERSPMDQRPTGQLLSNRPLLDARLAEPHVALELQRSTPSAPFVAIPRGAERPDLSVARIARTRDASLEELLAVGDEAGADAKALLENLLAQAGTEGGARLATGLIPSVPMVPVTTWTSRTSTSPTEAVSDVQALAPELRTKLVRVMDRMKQEYGHDVQVVETGRTQERQDWLYAQGRTRDGQVVTWTRDSAHTRGEAVDVKIDGGWDNQEAFARLQQVARDEGLRTLGMKDPGHLELPRSAAALASEASREQAPVPAANGTPRVAGVASVAGVAGVAGVASTADGNGASMNFGSDSRQSNEQPASREVTSPQSRERTDRRDDAAASTAAPLSTPLIEREAPTMPASAPAPAVPGASGRDPIETTRPVAGIHQAERVADLQQQRADAPVPTVSRLTLNLDNANGTQDRITVDLRGQGVSAQISTDAASADSLRLKTADLQDSLGRHGLDTDSVRISAAGRPDGAQGDTQSFTRQEDARRESARDAQREQARTRDDRQQEEQRRQERARFLDYLNGTN